MATTGTDNFGGASFTARLVDYFLGQTIEKENIKSETAEEKQSQIVGLYIVEGV